MELRPRPVRESIKGRAPRTLSASDEAELMEFGDDLDRPGGAVRTALRGCEAGSHVGLKLLEGRPESDQVAFDDRGHDPQQDDAAEPFRESCVDRLEFLE